MMHMTFYWGKEVTVLFSDWKTKTWSAYGLTLLAVFLFSIFYQYMEDRRLRFKIAFAGSAKTAPSSSIDSPLLYRVRSSSKYSAKVATAVLFGINSAIGYMLMLAVMSFNGGVFIAVVLGLAVGYLLFRTSEEETAVVVDNPCACA